MGEGEEGGGHEVGGVVDEVFCCGSKLDVSLVRIVCAVLGGMEICNSSVCFAGNERMGGCGCTYTTYRLSLRFRCAMVSILNCSFFEYVAMT